ncbi:MAG: GNAT family N-acetyltransferase [Oscillospiraceae bacterium]|nr:GNAT family N-acetyltransferase [Oscillospiraceae bacterium]
MAVTIGLLSKEGLTHFAQMCPDTIMSELKSDMMFAFGVFYDEQPAGFAAVGGLGDELYIHHMFVETAFRRLGIGSMLIDEVMNFCYESHLFKTVRCLLNPPQFGDIHLDSVCVFLKNRRFTLSEAVQRVYSVTLGEFGDNDYLGKWTKQENSNAVSHFQSFNDTPKHLLSGLMTTVEEQTGYIKFSEDSIYNNHSFAAIGDSEIDGTAIVENINGVLELSCVFCKTPAKAAAVIPHILRSVYDSLKEEFSPDTVLRIKTVTEASVKLIERLCPNVPYAAQVDAEADVVEYIIGQRVQAKVQNLMLQVQEV